MKDRNTERRESIVHFETLPTLIDTDYPCVNIADIPETIRRFAPNMPSSAVQHFQDSVLSIQKESLHPDHSYYAISSEMLFDAISSRVRDSVAADESTGVIVMDRSICKGEVGMQYYRLNVSRGKKGGLIARPGAKETTEQQLQGALEWISQMEPRRVIIVDDVLAYADTMVPLVTFFQENTTGIELSVFVGLASSQNKWSGIEKVRSATGIEVEQLCTIIASPENEWSSGMSILVNRDWTVFGGKVSVDPDTGLAITHPYFMPYSAPVASTRNSDRAAVRSLALIDLSKRMIQEIDKYRDTPLRLLDVLEAGYGIPQSSLDSVTVNLKEISLESSFAQYIAYTEELFVTNLELSLQEVYGDDREVI